MFERNRNARPPSSGFERVKLYQTPRYARGSVRKSLAGMTVSASGVGMVSLSAFVARVGEPTNVKHVPASGLVGMRSYFSCLVRHNGKLPSAEELRYRRTMMHEVGAVYSWAEEKGGSTLNVYVTPGGDVARAFLGDDHWGHYTS